MTVRDLLTQVSKRGPGVFGNDRKLVSAKFGDEIFDEHTRIFAHRKDFVKRNLCAPPIPRRMPRRLNTDMYKHECRKQWLHVLRAKEGTVAALAEKLGTDPNYINSLLGPSSNRDVGDDLAKRVEDAYHLPRGAIDLPSEGAAKIVKASEGLTDSEVNEVLDFIRFKKSTKN